MTRIGNLICDPQDLLREAGDLEKLATMLARVTRQDLERASQALKAAAQDVTYLLTGKQLVGCPCRTVAEYLIYEDACPHHRHLKHQLDAMKTAYEEAERKFQDTIRTKYAKAALAAAGAGNSDTHPQAVVKRAFQIADAMIAALSQRA